LSGNIDGEGNVKLDTVSLVRVMNKKVT